MNEATLVLDALHDRLSQLPADLVSPIVHDGGVVELLGGQLELAVRIHHDGAHPAIAHAHVLVTAGPSSGGERRTLDVCVVAVHVDRAKGLAGVGHTFCDLVAGPILSLLHGRPVLGATAFDAGTPGGIPGHRGYVGPLMVRGLADGEPDPFADVPTFDYADALAPPGVVHVAKVVFDARDDRPIRRTLEVDGHDASHVDLDWATGPSSPSNIVGLRFAVFEPTNPATTRRGRALDEAIDAFVEHFAATGDRDSAADRLVTSGVAAHTVHEIRLFVPAAYARLSFGGEFPLSETFIRVRADGWTDEDLQFMAERTYARALVLGRGRISRGEVSLVRKIGRTSAEIAAIEQALERGAALESLGALVPLIPDADVPSEVLERVAKQLYGS